MADRSFMDQLGPTVRAARKRQGLDQEELAMAAGVSARTVHKVESGHPTVRVDSVVKVLHALGLDIRVQDPDDR